MASVDDQKRYITLEDVRVSYKKKDDSIHLTSSDPDVAVEGFHMFLSKGTNTELLLRQLLVDKGVIRDAENPSLELGSFQMDRADLSKAPIISVTSPKGGSGKTNTALNLAVQLSRFTNPVTGEKFRVVVADFDVHDGQVGVMLGESTPTMLDYFNATQSSAGICGVNGCGVAEGHPVGQPLHSWSAAPQPAEVSEADDDFMKNVVKNEVLGVYALLAPQKPSSASLLTPEFYLNVLGKLATSFDIVIVDSTNNIDVRKIVLPVSDAILCVVPAMKSLSSTLALWFFEIEEEGADMSKVSFVINAYVDDDKTMDAIEYFWNHFSKFGLPIAAMPVSLELMQIDTPEERSNFLNTKSAYTVSLLKLAKQLTP